MMTLRDDRLIDQNDLEMLLVAGDVSFTLAASGEEEEARAITDLIARFYALNAEIKKIRSRLLDLEKSLARRCGSETGGGVFSGQEPDDSEAAVEAIAGDDPGDGGLPD